MLDRDLANLYQTETRTLKQAVKRNIERFPDDFMFELSENYISEMVSQSVIPSKSYFGGAKPFAFTEQGVSMLASVIKTEVAVKISVRIIRAFVNMRKFLSENAEVFKRLDNLEKHQKFTDERLKLDVKKYNEQYGNMKLKKFTDSHDRFLIIDEKEVYHFGASLKDLGKKWFAFSKFDLEILRIMEKLEEK